MREEIRRVRRETEERIEKWEKETKEFGKQMEELSNRVERLERRKKRGGERGKERGGEEKRAGEKGKGIRKVEGDWGKGEEEEKYCGQRSRAEKEGVKEKGKVMERNGGESVDRRDNGGE